MIETERLTLRLPRISDFEAIAEMRGDGEVMRLISGRPQTREESWSRLLRTIGHWQALGFGYWLMEDLRDRQFIGEIGFGHFKRDMDPPLGNRPEIGWVLPRKFWGKGLATEAARAIVQWADQNLEATETVCIFAPEHEASKRVAIKVGYSEAGMAVYKGDPTLVMTRPRGVIGS